MIRHIVMFKLKEDAEGSDKAGNIQSLKAKLEALPGKIEEIRFFEVGINFSDNGVDYDMVLDSKFESKEALYSYRKNPEHIEVADFIQRVCENRVVVDYII